MTAFTLRIAAAFALAATLSVAIAAQAPKKDTLYKRLGGYDAIAAVDRFKVPTQEKNELVAAVGALKADIVEKK